MIAQIDIINLSHFDIGFTDHPSVCRKLQSRYLDMAIDLVAANRHRDPALWFYWTCESNNVVLEWWQRASEARRTLFLQLVQAGWIEVCAMPFNNQPTLDADQWRTVARWLPEELWQACRPRTIIQDDVNGFPRAGALALMDRGVEFLWMAINGDTGGSPLMQPSAFWWQMPDGRKLFVWNSVTYPQGYFLFEPNQWRRGPLPQAGDPRYRPPERGDFFDPSPGNLARAHATCRARLEAWERQGLALDRIAVSMTNMWRIDNDPPCELLTEFVAAWNAAGFVPRLALTTPSLALDAIRASVTEQAPTLAGEWTDWWANGPASTPRELAATRRAKRVLTALDELRPSLPSLDGEVIDECRRQLCLFDEHTWGSWQSVSRPDSIDSQGQFAEKASLAYRPLVMAELALGDAVRAIAPRTRGVHVVNPYARPFTGWITLTDDCLRGTYEGVKDALTGQEQRFGRLPGVSAFYTVPTDLRQFSPLDSAQVFPDAIADKNLRFWVADLGPGEVRSFELLERAAQTPAYPDIQVQCDAEGWPAMVQWPDGTLFSAPIGDFAALEVQGFAPRWTYKEILACPTEAERRTACDRALIMSQAVPVGPATLRDTGPTWRYEQVLAHPRLHAARRVIELFKASRRVRLELTLNRISKPASAEIFYLRLPLDCAGYDVQLTTGGLAFRPGIEQLPHTCRDYFTIDGRVTYTKGSRQVVLECHDNALVALGGMYDGLRLEQLGSDLATVYAIVYNNVWYTNFAGDEAGVTEYAFDLYGQDASQKGFAPAAFPVVRV